MLVMNLVGVGLGVTLTRHCDRCDGGAGRGTTLFRGNAGFHATFVSCRACFLFAGLRFERDRARLFKDVDDGRLPSKPHRTG